MIIEFLHTNRKVKPEINVRIVWVKSCGVTLILEGICS